MNGSGNVITETRQTGNFTGIDAGGAFEIEVRTGSATEVKVEADDNLIKYIETRVSGNTLTITTKEGINFNNGHYKVYITAPEINAINSSGAATITVKNTLKSSGKITLESSGAATLTGEIDAPEVSIDASGATNVTITGRTKNYTLEASGSATVKTGSLMSETAKVNASGASGVYVYSSVSLNAEADGAATVHYKGSGSTVVNTSGAGSARKDD